MRIHPGGPPLVHSTHDQVLGGELRQTFVGCRFPAEQANAASIVREARKAGDCLATRGLTGSFGIDFIVMRRDAVWQPYAVEINLRDGGTSHPSGTLRLPTNGSLDRAKTTFRTPYGQKKFYFATDRLGHPDYRKIGLKGFLAAATVDGLDWNPACKTGAVFHVLGSLEEQGRIGVTATGDAPDQAYEFYLGVARLLDRPAADPAVGGTVTRRATPSTARHARAGMWLPGHRRWPCEH
jgi:hypothetical protein